MQIKSTQERPRASLRSFRRPQIECAQCGDALFMPDWSEHLDATRVRHLWRCDACGYAFETTVHFAAA